MSTCPYCNSDGAYNSGFSVECSNPDCRCFSLTQCRQWMQDFIREHLKRYVSSQPGELSPIVLPTPFEVVSLDVFGLGVSWPQRNNTYEYVLKIEF